MYEQYANHVLNLMKIQSLHNENPPSKEIMKIKKRKREKTVSLTSFWDAYTQSKSVDHQFPYDKILITKFRYYHELDAEMFVSYIISYITIRVSPSGQYVHKLNDCNFLSYVIYTLIFV